MEELTLLEGSIIAAVAVIFIKYLLDFLKPLIEKRRNGGQTADEKQVELLKEICLELRGVRQMTRELYKWHDEGRDQDGRFLWYVPTSLESTMGKLADAVVDLSRVLAAMDRNVSEQRKETAELIGLAREAHARGGK
jgi:hypothetical protein